MKKYSVSLVYLKDQPGKDTFLVNLLVLITSAVSKEEALGKAIRNFDEETKEYSLKNKVVIEIEES